MDLTGLPHFTDRVAKFLAANAVTAVVELGWRKNVQQINEGSGTANRIVVQPGDLTGSAGKLASPRQIGQGPRTHWPPKPFSGDDAQFPDDQVGRELDDFEEKATVFIWAADATASEDDRRQYVAVRTLLTWFRRAAVYAARQACDVDALEWVNIENVERQYGRELALGITLHSPIFDLADDIAHPTEIDLSSSQIEGEAS